MNLSGKVALVTGGGKRVGQAIALRLADEGCDVAITVNRSVEEGQATAEAVRERGRRAWVVPMDLHEPAAAQQTATAITQQCGRLDVLVHNASVYARTPWGQVTPEAMEEHWRVNALGPVMLTQALRPLLSADEGGRVIHMVDAHLLERSRRGYAAYSMSKAALLEATYVLAREMAPKVTVNAIAPGVVAWAAHEGDDERQAYLSKIPLGRPGTVDDAAAAVVYLARDADYITGQVLKLDGGRTLG